MYNFSVAEAYAALAMLDIEGRAALKASLSSNISSIDDKALGQALLILKHCRSAFREFKNYQVLDRLRHFENILSCPHRPRWADYEAETRFLAQTIQIELVNSHFYYYPPDKLRYLTRFSADWDLKDPRLTAARAHALAAVDCYALNHATACVFHLMMAMEIGVQAFGNQLGVDLAVIAPGKKVRELTWKEILNAINPKMKAVQQNTIDEKRTFEKYSAVQAYLYRVADAWRNPTMHPRDQGYNGPEAENIMNHVRPFMNDLDAILR
jgi:hypothetical protein